MEKDMEVNMAIYYCGNTPTPWGDWGESLIHGTLARNEKTGERSIERVGPFTPAAYISYGSLIFTHPAKEALKSSNLNGIDRYEFLKKTRIVRLEWQHWDAKKPITDYLDLAGGPSTIIENHKHDAELSKQMPDYWQAFVSKKLSLSMLPDNESLSIGNYLKVIKADNDMDFFKGDIHGGYFVSERAKTWLERHCPGCFTFSLIPFAD